MWGECSVQGTVEGEMVLLFKDIKLQSYQAALEELTSRERIDFVYNLLKKSALFNKIVDEPRYRKSNEKSLAYRTSGNNFYIRQRNFLGALESYTQSIAYADDGSDYLATAYGNRSAVLYERGYHEECVKDIERALQNNYPDNLKEKILTRKKKAEELKTKQQPINYYTPVPPIQNKNAHISAASDSVEIRKNEKLGRHIVATKAIKVGEAISVEECFAHIVNSESKWIHCNECLDICYNMIPCKRCPTALYCSENCLQQAYSYHKYECDMMPLLHRFPQLFVKIAVKGLKEYKDTGNTELDEMYRSDRFKEVNELITNDGKRDYINTCIHLLTVCVCYHSLITNDRFLCDFDMANIDLLLKDLLYRSYLVQTFNPFTIKKIKYTLYDTKASKVGTVMYAFTSLFNHSCVPNCEFFHHGTALVIRAITNINKGEQCTLCYGISYSTTEITRRRMILQRNYLFDCECRACMERWPTFNNLPLGTQIPPWFELKVAQNTFEDTEANKKLLDELLTDAFVLFKSSQRREPSQNFLRIQNLITEIYTYMACKDLDF